MQNVFNPLVGMYQTQLEASRRFADAIFSGTQKIDRVMIGATHRAFTEQLNFVQAMAGMRDPRSAEATIRSRFLARNPDEAMNDQKEIMRIVVEMQNEIGQSLQECVEQLRRQASIGAPEQAVDASRMRQDEAAFNPVTSMFSVWESAFKEVAALARKNMLAGRMMGADGAGGNAGLAAGGFANAMETAGNIASSMAGAATNMASGDDADNSKGGSKRRH